jgi:6-phospho-beta-glucosidase
LIQQVKSAEQLTIRAARTGSPSTALAALAVHPLVDSVSTAKILLAGYRSSIPEVAAVLA